jgi:hypothetical protein
MIPADDVARLRDAFRANPRDLGVGLYNPTTGEIRLGSFDNDTDGKGHEGLADALGITDDAAWRGFSLSASGLLAPVSHFNMPDGSLLLRPEYEATVRAALRLAGLIPGRGVP